VFANGDIDSAVKAARVLEVTGAAGIMIGRAAQGRPWIFRQVKSYLASRTSIAPPSVRELRDIILSHLDSLYAFHGEDTGVRVARKHIGWYLRQLSQAPRPTPELMKATRATDQLALLREFLEQADGSLCMAA
jgi:tRNA-dihydrouridine synthase B